LQTCFCDFYSFFIENAILMRQKVSTNSNTQQQLPTNINKKHQQKNNINSRRKSGCFCVLSFLWGK